jgi:glyoxylase-like metal-dependent hydrolase (beta-lactamase superfamily II)
MRALVHSSMFEIQQSFERLTPDRLLSGGETIATAHGALEVLWTPGHSPGHVCLYDRERRVLISGDHILQHISPNIGWQPGRDALGEFLSSLDRIAALDVDLILPSHGAPFTGHREWVRKTHEHHAERCARIVDAHRWRRHHRPPDRREACGTATFRRSTTGLRSSKCWRTWNTWSAAESCAPTGRVACIAGLWGRLATCRPIVNRPSLRRLTIGAQDTILPHS